MRKVKTPIAFIVFILTLTLNCFGQYHFDKSKISSQTERVVAKIEKINELMGSAVYYAGIRPPQYDNFTELRNKASQDELGELTNHPNGVVRCYAFWALTFIPSVDLLPIVVAHVRDTGTVHTQFGCIGGRENVGDFFIETVTPHNIDEITKKLTSAEFAYLDSILIYTPNELYAKERAIERAKLTEQLYSKVRDMVINERNQSALVTLAKYKKEQDIPLILNNKIGSKPEDGFFYTYKAIAAFPHADFLSLLQKNLQETLSDDHYDAEWRELYRAIASYKNDTAFRLLQIPFTQVKHADIRKYHIEYVFGAIQDFYSPVYEPLLWQMWENEKLINRDVFNMLYPKNMEKAFQLTKKTILQADDFYYINTEAYNEDEGPRVNLLDVMLDTILVRDRPFAIDLINKNIREINVHQFPTFADRAFEIKDPSFVVSLLDRLRKEWNPHIYLKATEVLIGFKDKDIDRRIVEAAKRNPDLRKGWGGQAFSKLLKDNNIR